MEALRRLLSFRFYNWKSGAAFEVRWGHELAAIFPPAPNWTCGAEAARDPIFEVEI